MSESATQFEPEAPVDIGATPVVTPEPVVEQPSTETKPARPKNPREAMVRAIAERYESQQRAKELKYAEVLHEEAHDRAEGQEVGTTTHAREVQEQQQPTHEPTVATTPVVEQPQPTRPARRSIPINGQQVELSEDEITHLADMGARALAYLRQQQAQPPQQPVPQPQPVQRQPTPAVDTPASLDDAIARDLVHRLSYGSPDDATNAVKQIHEHAARAAVETLSRQQQQSQLDPRLIIQAAREETLGQIRMENNLMRVGAEFSNIFGPPNPVDQAEQSKFARRSQLAALVLHEIRSRDMNIGRQRADIDYYREACRTVADELGIPATLPATASPGTALATPAQPSGQQTTASPAIAPSTTRVERKRAAPNQPSSATRVASEVPRQYETNSQYIDRLRQQRGQVPMH